MTPERPLLEQEDQNEFPKGNGETEYKIFSPSQNDLESMPFEQLHEHWRENHKKLQKILSETNFPFFGLHGTSQEAHKNIQAKGGHVNIATFYEKNYKTEQFIYQLYAAAGYVSRYAIGEKWLGRILIFNLEDDKGENISLPWEYLKGAGMLIHPLNLDSEEERRQFAKLNDMQNLLWRSDLDTTISNNEMIDRLIGSVDLADDELKQYNSKLDIGGLYILRKRFLSQEILARLFKILAEKK